MDLAILFDMDGVICHTNPFHSQAFQVFFERRKIFPTEGEFREHMYGKNNAYILSHFLGRPIAGEELGQLEDEKEGLFREIYKQHIDPIWGFLPFLRELKAEGFKTGVATSAPYANLDLIATKLGLFSVMESVLASEDVKSHKPDPEVYLLSAKNLGMDPARCLVFEDSVSGVQAARNAGMKVIGVLSSHSREELPPCEWYIRDYSEISLEIIQTI